MTMDQVDILPNHYMSEVWEEEEELGECRLGSYWNYWEVVDFKGLGLGIGSLFGSNGGALSLSPERQFALSCELGRCDGRTL
jgi:hypothetical protein